MVGNTDTTRATGNRRRRTCLEGATQPQTPQPLNALRLNTFTLEGLALQSFGSSVLKLKVDSAAGTSVIPVGASPEPVQTDDKTG
eukprot:174379-Amphidinium_carterae.1